jgi:hypothetical protein
MDITWSDDFSGSGAFDGQKWDYYKKPVQNGEVEEYLTSGDNCKLSGQGTLMITPTKDGDKWKSCRIESQPAWAAAQGGKIRFQSKFKLGTPGVNLQGIWPAFWALGKGFRSDTPWPACGEIDTFEAVNSESKGHGTIHCAKSCHDNPPDSKGIGKEISFDYGTFHTWAHEIDRTSSDWKNQTITWTMDGTPYHERSGTDLLTENPGIDQSTAEQDWVSLTQKEFFITLNVAVGGSWPGPPSPTTAEGKDAGMELQYVAVYQSGGSSPGASPSDAPPPGASPSDAPPPGAPPPGASPTDAPPPGAPPPGASPTDAPPPGASPSDAPPLGAPPPGAPPPGA